MQKFDQAMEVLAFTLGGEGYGIEIHTVQELRGYGAVTRIANTPDYMKGVINLRGLIVPIIDMRLKFNLGQPEYNDFTVVIIINLSNKVLGIVVDSVSEVITLAPEQIKPPPQIGSAFNTDYLIGMAALENRMLTLVDIDLLLADAELQIIDRIAA